MKQTRLAELAELRALAFAGAVLSVTLEGEPKGFALKIATRSRFVSVHAKNSRRVRVFVDPRAALRILRELGIANGEEHRIRKNRALRQRVL